MSIDKESTKKLVAEMVARGLMRHPVKIPEYDPLTEALEKLTKTGQKLPPGSIQTTLNADLPHRKPSNHV